MGIPHNFNWIVYRKTAGHNKLPHRVNAMTMDRHVGHMTHERYAERYPSLNWNAFWGHRWHDHILWIDFVFCLSYFLLSQHRTTNWTFADVNFVLITKNSSQYRPLSAIFVFSITNWMHLSLCRCTNVLCTQMPIPYAKRLNSNRMIWSDTKYNMESHSLHLVFRFASDASITAYWISLMKQSIGLSMCRCMTTHCPMSIKSVLHDFRISKCGFQTNHFGMLAVRMEIKAVVQLKIKLMSD